LEEVYLQDFTYQFIAKFRYTIMEFSTSVNNICLRYNGVFLGKQNPAQVGFKARKMDYAAVD
jgi:hypothetical protein